MTDREIINLAGDLLDEICDEYKRDILDYFDSNDLLKVVPNKEIISYVKENDLIMDVTIMKSPVSIIDVLKHDLLFRLKEEYDLEDIEEMERLFISSKQNKN